MKGDIYKDPRWQRKRLEILQRDGFKCCWCGAADKPLHVHHRYYLSGRKPWEYLNGALVTLCDDCHELRPLIPEQWEFAFETLLPYADDAEWGSFAIMVESAAEMTGWDRNTILKKLRDYLMAMVQAECHLEPTKPLCMPKFSNHCLTEPSGEKLTPSSSS